MKSKPDLPFFGPYVMVPLWFLNYCVPQIGPHSAAVWQLLFSKTRWKQGKMTVSIPVKSIARLCGCSPNCVKLAIFELIGNDLLQISAPKKGNPPKSYTVLLYTPENARLRFNDGLINLRPKVTNDRWSFFDQRMA